MAVAIAADVSQEEDVRLAFELTETEIGPLTAAFANAGIAGGPFEQASGKFV